jgi:hypothetical protein
MIKYTRRYIRKADRVYDPNDPYRFSYERSTPESEAEFYRIFGGGPIAFTRPGTSVPPTTPTPSTPQPTQQTKRRPRARKKK